MPSRMAVVNPATGVNDNVQQRQLASQKGWGAKELAEKARLKKNTVENVLAVDTFIRKLQSPNRLGNIDGKGSYHDNIFTERFWRSVKYEEVYLKEYAALAEAEQGIAAYISFYNDRRPHQALAYQTPQQVHFALARSLSADMLDSGYKNNQIN